MVLVDSSHPDQEKPIPPGSQELGCGVLLRNSSNAIHLPIGCLGLSRRAQFHPKFGQSFVAVFCRRQYLAESERRQLPSKKTPRQVRSLRPASDFSAGGFPMTHKVRFPGKSDRSCESRVGPTCKEELAQPLLEWFHIVVKGERSRYTIDKPEAVVDAIRKVVGQAGG